jgi:tRNA pseudouridine55 synthase
VQVLGINRGCRSLGEYLNDCEKRYVARAVLGVATDTLDAEGAVTETKPWAHVTRDALDAAAAEFVPGYLQEAPLYSALKVG